MKHPIRAFAVAITLLMPLAAPAKAVSIMGAGASSCGTWLNDRNTNNLSVYNMRSWALGYLSAIALMKNPAFKDDPLKDLDTNGIFYWLDNYCRKYPTSDFSYATDALVMAHFYK